MSAERLSSDMLRLVSSMVLSLGTCAVYPSNCVRRWRFVGESFHSRHVYWRGSAQPIDISFLAVRELNTRRASSFSCPLNLWDSVASTLARKLLGTHCFGRQLSKGKNVECLNAMRRDECGADCVNSLGMDKVMSSRGSGYNTKRSKMES